MVSFIGNFGRNKHKQVWIILVGFSAMLISVLGQTSSKFQVDQQAEQELLDFLQNNGVGITLENDTNQPEEIQYSEPTYQPYTYLAQDNIQAPITEKNNSSKNSFVPNIISNYSLFIDNQDTEFFIEQSRRDFGIISRVDFEAVIGLAFFQICTVGLERFGRSSYNAIGIIRVKMQDGSEEYCVGTLLSDDAVITMAECYRQDASEYSYQPAWSDDWVQIRDWYLSEDYVQQGKHSFAVFYLQQKINDAPRIGYTMAVPTTQRCHITVLGWQNHLFSSLFSGNYKMVTCPKLPQLEQKLGAVSQNCEEDFCSLDDLGFVSGSPIILTCPNPIKHALIGMLRFEQDNQSNGLFEFFEPNMVVVPYMFTPDTYWDIDGAVWKSRS